MDNKSDGSSEIISFNAAKKLPASLLIIKQPERTDGRMEILNYRVTQLLKNTVVFISRILISYEVLL